MANGSVQDIIASMGEAYSYAGKVAQATIPASAITLGRAVHKAAYPGSITPTTALPAVETATATEQARALFEQGELPVVGGAAPVAIASGAGAASFVTGLLTRFWPQIAGAIGGLGLGSLLFGGDGGGNGGGGTDLSQMVVGGVPLGGPGLAEPPAALVAKEWKRRIDSKDGDFNLQYYLVHTQRGYKILMYNTRTGRWKSWSLPKPAVIGKNMPSHKMLTRLRRNLKKHQADAKTILQVASPTAYARQLGYRKPRRRR